MEKRDQLFKFLEDNNLLAFRELLQSLSDSDCIKQVNKRYLPLGNTLLMEAVTRNQIEFIRVLLEFNADVNMDNESDRTALLKAINANNLEVIELLLQYGADPTLLTRWGKESGKKESAMDIAQRTNTPNKAEILSLLNRYAPLKLRKGTSRLKKLRIAQAEVIPRMQELIGSFYQQQLVPWNRGRILLLGESGAGKTSLARGLKEIAFDNNLPSTIGIAKHSCEVLAGNSWKEIDQGMNETNTSALTYIYKQVKHTTSVASTDTSNVSDKNQKSSSVANHLYSSELGKGDKHSDFEAVEASSFQVLYHCLQENVYEDDHLPMKVSLFDFAGQDEFRVLHSFFLTPDGVYLLVFDMKKLLDLSLQSKCLEELSMWWESLLLNLFTCSNLSKKSSGDIVKVPLAFIGTHKDCLSGNLHERYQEIAQILQLAFEHTIAWSSLLNSTSSGTVLPFFPVNNILGKDDIFLQEMKTSLLDKILQQPGFQQEIPLWWLECYDLLSKQSEKSCLYTYPGLSAFLYQHFPHLTSTITERDIFRMIRHFHQSRMWLWIHQVWNENNEEFVDFQNQASSVTQNNSTDAEKEEDNEEDDEVEESVSVNLIIINPIEFFVQPVSEIISRPLDNRIPGQLTSRQERAKALSESEWDYVERFGVCSQALLDSMIQDHPVPNVLLYLMIKFSIIIPISHSKDISRHRHRRRNHLMQAKEEKKYLVPSFFPKISHMEPSYSPLPNFLKPYPDSNRGIWSGSIMQPSPQRFSALRQTKDRFRSPRLVKSLPDSTIFYFSCRCLPFSLSSTSSSASPSSALPKIFYSTSEVSRYFTLPVGLFQHLIGKTITECCHLSSSSVYDIKQVISGCSQSKITLTYGHQCFTMRVSPHFKMIELAVEGSFPLPLLQRLKRRLNELLSCYYHHLSLELVTLVPYPLFSASNTQSESLYCEGLDSSPFFSESTRFLLEIEDVQNIIQEEQQLWIPLAVPGDHSFNEVALDSQELLRLYGSLLSITPQRMQQTKPPEYDFFLSYHWTEDNSAFVDQLWNEMSLFHLHTSQTSPTSPSIPPFSASAPPKVSNSSDPNALSYARATPTTRYHRVYFDKRSNQFGDRFQERFVSAILQSSVWVPIVSLSIFERWQSHNPQEIDNVLLEWILMLFYLKSMENHTKSLLEQDEADDEGLEEKDKETKEKGVGEEAAATTTSSDRYCFSKKLLIPIFLGILKKKTQSGPSLQNVWEMEDLFDQSILRQPNTIIPSATLNTAIQILKTAHCFCFDSLEEDRLSQTSLQEIIERMKGYLGLKTVCYYQEYLEKYRPQQYQQEIDYLLLPFLSFPSSNGSVRSEEGIPIKGLSAFQDFLISSCCKELLRRYRQDQSFQRLQEEEENSSLSSCSEDLDRPLSAIPTLQRKTELARLVQELSLEEVQQLVELCQQRLLLSDR